MEKMNSAISKSPHLGPACLRVGGIRMGITTLGRMNAPPPVSPPQCSQGHSAFLSDVYGLPVSPVTIPNVNSLFTAQDITVP